MPRAQRSDTSASTSVGSEKRPKRTYKFSRPDLDFLNNTTLEPWGISPEQLAQTWNSYSRVHVRATELFQKEKTLAEEIHRRHKDPATRPEGLLNLNEIKMGVKRFGEGPTLKQELVKQRMDTHHAGIIRELKTVEDYYKANTHVFNAHMIFDEYYIRQPLVNERKKQEVIIRRIQQLEQDMIYEEVPHRVPLARRAAPPTRTSRFARKGATDNAPTPHETPSKTQNEVSTPSARSLSKEAAETLATDFTKLFRSSFTLNPSESVVGDGDESPDTGPETWRVATCDFDKLEYGVVCTGTSSEPLLHDHEAFIGLLMMSTPTSC